MLGQSWKRRRPYLFNVLPVRRKLRTRSEIDEDASFWTFSPEIFSRIKKPTFGRSAVHARIPAAHFLVKTSPCRVFLLPLTRPALPLASPATAPPGNMSESPDARALSDDANVDEIDNNSGEPEAGQPLSISVPLSSTKRRTHSSLLILRS